MTRIHALLGALTVAFLVASAGEARAEQTIELKVGEKLSLEVASISRVAVNEPSVVDARPLTGNTLAIEAVGEGSSWLRVWRKDGSRVSYTVVVKGFLEPKVDAKTAATLVPPKKPAVAHCDKPKRPDAARALEEGTRLAKDRKLPESLAALEKARQLEPAAAIVLLHLGTTYARLARLDEGALAYESFLQSCPNHPQAHAVRDVLNEYNQRTGKR